MKPPPGKRPLKTLERVLSKAGLGSRAGPQVDRSRTRKRERKDRSDAGSMGGPGTRPVTLDDKPVRSAKKIYLLLYKPKGYITTLQRSRTGDPRFTI